MYALFRAAIIGVCILATTTPALALMPTAIVPQPHAPVHIDQCIAGTRSTGPVDAMIPNYYLDFAANFTNVSSKDVSAVRLRFDVFNSFGEHLQTKYGTDDAQTVNAGAQQTDIVHNTAAEQLAREHPEDDQSPTYLPAWEFINTADTAHTVICSVDTVMYTTGSKWQAASPKDAALTSALKRASAQAGIFYKSED